MSQGLVNYAAELLKEDHPLHTTFVKWVNGRQSETAGHVVKTGRNLSTVVQPPLSKRQARKFLALTAHQRFRAPAKAA